MGFFIVDDPTDPKKAQRKMEVPGLIGSNILRHLAMIRRTKSLKSSSDSGARSVAVADLVLELFEPDLGPKYSVLVYSSTFF